MFNVYIYKDKSCFKLNCFFFRLPLKIFIIRNYQVVAAFPAMVRIEIQRSEYKKIVCCLMFPQDYPHDTILMELKSKTLSDKLLSGLTKV